MVDQSWLKIIVCKVTADKTIFDGVNANETSTLDNRARSLSLDGQRSGENRLGPTEDGLARATDRHASAKG
jgi:hypothetical protein